MTADSLDENSKCCQANDGMTGACQCAKSALSDMIQRFLTSGISVDFSLNAHMLKKASDGTWTSSKRSMNKHEQIQIASLDLLVGAMAICAVTSICSMAHGLKKKPG